VVQPLADLRGPLERQVVHGEEHGQVGRQLEADLQRLLALGQQAVEFQVGQDAIAGIAPLFALLGAQARRFLVFIDDLGFEDGDGAGPRLLRSWLEGGVEARPGNVRLAVTSNRRAIVPRHMREQASSYLEDGPINPRDAVDDQLALADRFGLSIGFHNCSQDDYLAIVAGYMDDLKLAWEQNEALEWSRRRGARSGRVAWQFVTEIAGRAGRAI